MDQEKCKINENNINYNSNSNNLMSIHLNKKKFSKDNT
jgi:hypothetical protein